MSQILEVEWEDASSGSGWREPSELLVDKKYIVTTIGYVVRNDDDYVILVQNFDVGNVSNYMKIPRAYIRSSKVIRRGNQIK